MGEQQKPVSLTDPYLDPNNIHLTRDGAVAYGPHGEQFRLTDEDASVVLAIRQGIMPSPAQQLSTWLEEGRNAQIDHPG